MSQPSPTTIRVGLTGREYDIEIGALGWDGLGARCADLVRGRSALIVTDDRVAEHHLEACQAALTLVGFHAEAFVFPEGEASKSVETYRDALRAGVRAGLDRRSLVVALGGGVPGDLGGFVAATLLRGIRYVQVPTTVVALVDSAVGGKTGINLPEGKNLVGAFHQPALVWANLDTLATLPDREFRSGLAEVVKYGVIADAEFFVWLEDRRDRILARDPAALGEMVARSCRIKARVVEQDEREGGLRAILNFGHTLGHAIEAVAGYGRFLHGEAIAMGMVYAARLSGRATGFPASDAARIRALLEALGLPVLWPHDLDWARIASAFGVDKKAEGGMPRWVLAERIGAVRFGIDVAPEVLEEVWHERHE